MTSGSRILQMKSISILTPVYNGEKTLEIFLASINRQYIPAGLQAEFIVCDDGSTDKTGEIITKYVQELNQKYKISLISNDNNQGWRFSLSKLYEQSTGEIIVFIDSDAIPVQNDWLETLIKPLLSEEIFVVQGDFWGQLKSKGCINKQHEKWRKATYFSRFQNKDKTLNTVNTRNLAIKRSLIEEVKKRFGYFLIPEAVLCGADTDLGYKINGMGYKIYLNDLAKIRHNDPSNFLDLIKQKIKHGYGDGRLGINYKHNFYYSVYLPMIRYRVWPIFSLPLTVCFFIANKIGLMKKII